MISAMYISPVSSRFPPVLFYWVFIPCDVISLILQAAGGAMSASSNGENETGVDIALAGLSFPGDHFGVLRRYRCRLYGT